MMKRLFATAALTTLATSAAIAQSSTYNPEVGPYLGAGVGHAMLDNATFEDLDDLGVDTDDNDVGLKVFAGYQFNRHFAVEASYLDFGDFTADITVTNGIDTGTADGKVSVEGFGFAALGKLPIRGPAFSLYGKLGMIAWDGEATGTARVNGNLVFHERESADDIDPFYGVGAEYIVNQLVMRAEYERYDLSDSGEDFEIDMISGSLGYRF